MFSAVSTKLRVSQEQVGTLTFDVMFMQCHSQSFLGSSGSAQASTSRARAWLTSMPTCYTGLFFILNFADEEAEARRS